MHLVRLLYMQFPLCPFKTRSFDSFSTTTLSGGDGFSALDGFDVFAAGEKKEGDNNKMEAQNDLFAF